MEFETQTGAEDKFPFFPTSAGKNISIWSKKQRRKGILYAGKFKHYYLMVCSIRSHKCSTFSLAIKYVHLNEKESWTSSFWGSRHFPYHGFPRYDRKRSLSRHVTMVASLLTSLFTILLISIRRPKASLDNTLLDLLNYSYPTRTEFINCFIIHSK